MGGVLCDTTSILDRFEGWLGIDVIGTSMITLEMLLTVLALSNLGKISEHGGFNCHLVLPWITEATAAVI